MISRQDLNSFYIDFDRMLKRYVNGYQDLEEELYDIKFILSLLLNDYFMDEVEINLICVRYDSVLWKLRVGMVKLDIYKLFDEVSNTLEGINKEYEVLEKYEICNNISRFIEKFDNTLYTK